MRILRKRRRSTNTEDIMINYLFSFWIRCSLLEKVRGLLQQHDELKKSEAEFKESCRTDLANLQQQIE